MFKKTNPFQPSINGYDLNGQWISESQGKQLLKVKELEKYLYKLVSVNVSKFNEHYGTDFRDLSSINAFSVANSEYIYGSKVKLLRKWILSVWNYARVYQNEVREGRVFNEQEFVDDIPKYTV
jgi:hypothetical protein